MALYKYLYYRLYTWNLKTWGESDFPQYNALFGVSFMMFLNLVFIAGIFDIFGLKGILRPAPKNAIIIVIVTIIAINYFWLVKGKYRIIAKGFKNETKNKRLRNALLLWLYFIASFAIVICEAIFSGKMNGLR